MANQAVHEFIRAKVSTRGSGEQPESSRQSSDSTVSVQLQCLSKQYGRFGAVRNLSLDVFRGEFLTLLGPSGSGKTTTLMMLAGFVNPTSGKILVEGRDITNEPPHRRNIGMVYQSYALFPHLSVLRNVAFPLEVRKCSRDETKARAMEALSIVKLESLADRYPSQLSGGQQQRVALARAIVFRPSLLLMDEPLGALDKKLREHMQVELMKIKSRLDVTVVYVTHDQEEALTMSDRVVVMADGVIQQIGHPKDLYERPVNRFVADFIGDTNIFDGEIVTTGPLITVMISPGVMLHAESSKNFPIGDRVCVILRPERVRVGAESLNCKNQLEGVIDRVVYIGDNSRVRVLLATGNTLVAKLQNCGQTLSMNAGDRIRVGWDRESTWLVPAPQNVPTPSALDDDGSF